MCVTWNICDTLCATVFTCLARNLSSLNTIRCLTLLQFYQQRLARIVWCCCQQLFINGCSSLPSWTRPQAALSNLYKHISYRRAWSGFAAVLYWTYRVQLFEVVLKLSLSWQHWYEPRQTDGENTHAAESGTSANEHVDVMFKLKSTCRVNIHSRLAQQEPHSNPRQSSSWPRGRACGWIMKCVVWSGQTHRGYVQTRIWT